MTRVIVALLTILLALAGAASAEPVVKRGEGDSATLQGWRRVETGLPAGAKLLLAKEGAPLVRLGLIDRPEADLAEATAAGLSAFGFVDAVVEGRAAITQTKQLDEDGEGATLVGRARKDGASVRFAAIALYGSLDERPRSTGVHFFAAPEDAYRTHGAWLPVSVFWHDFDAASLRSSRAELANAAPADQAAALARATDVWIEYMVRAITRQMAVNLQALNNARVMSLCGDARDRGDGWFVCD